MGSQATRPIETREQFFARRAAGLAAYARYEKTVAALEFHRSRGDKAAEQHYQAQCDAIDETLFALEAINHHTGCPAFLLDDAELAELQAIYPTELARLQAQADITPALALAA